MMDTLLQWQIIKGNLQSRFSNLESIFKELDSNNNKTIEYEKLENELKNNHQIQDNDQINAIFSLLNISKNGKISQNEFESIWTGTDKLIQQEQIKQQFQKQKQQTQQIIQPESIILKQSIQKSGSAQQFSDLFNSYKSNNSPKKYINIQNEFTINQFTPPLIAMKNSPLKILSPSKPEQYPKTQKEAKEDKLKIMQRQITNLFTNKFEQKNTSPKMKENLGQIMNTMKLGIGNNNNNNNNNNNYLNRRSSGHTYKFESIKSNNISPKLQDQLSLQNYAYQFNDNKIQFKQTYSGDRVKTNKHTFFKI